MSHSRIHRLKQQKSISHAHQNIVNFIVAYFKNKNKQTSIKANTSIRVVRTYCDQHNRQRQRKHEMQLSVVVKQEMSHPIIHHLKQQNPITHTHQNIVNFIVNHRPNIFYNVSSRI